MKATAPFKIADCYVEPQSLRVSRRGQEARLEAKAMQVLVYLAANAGQVVRRDELEEQIWPNTYVTEDAVTNAVAKVRRAFQDDARNPKFIETIPKVGYRIIAEVEPAEGVARSESGGKSPGSHDGLASITETQNRFRFSAVAGVRLLAASLILVAIISAVVAWIAHYDFLPAHHHTDVQESEGPLIPKKPSIAVLPFKYIGGDERYSYLSDGITEDIITDISKFRSLFVIASSTTFTFKGKAVNVRRVSRQLGVRYILEGSVQRVGEQIRVNAQLIDAEKGHHIWAERLAGEIKDLVALQDEMVRFIVATLAGAVDVAERERAMRKPTENFKAYDYALRGRVYRGRSTRSMNAKAREMFKRAIKLDPTYAAAYAGLGWSHMDAFLWGWVEDPGGALQEAQQLAHKALNLDGRSGSAHRLLGITHLKWQQYPAAIAEYQRALELNPNDAESHAGIGGALLFSGQHDAAIKAIETARRFNPNLDPASLIDLGLAYYLKGRYSAAIMPLELVLRRNPNLAAAHIILAATYANAERFDDAERAIANVRRLHPFFKVDAFGSAFRKPEDRASLRSGLRKAGLQ